MHIMLTDETNMSPTSDVRFFAYGGLLFPIEQLVHLDEGVQTIRKKAGYHPEDELKFDTRARPDHITIETATEAKKQIINLCLDLECKFIAYIILHDIIEQEKQKQWLKDAVNHVIARYNYYLHQINDYGICIIDNPPIRAPFQYAAEKFSYGLGVPGKTPIPLDKIKMFAFSCINASNAMSALDIVLGSFRYCINNPRNPEAAQKMIPHVLRIMWHHYDPATDTYDTANVKLCD